MKINYYIFGAHSRAKTLAVYLKELHEEMSLAAYLYDNDEKNEKIIEGVPVYDLNGNPLLDTTCPVYIGTRGVHHNEVEEKLRKLGFQDIRPVTLELDMTLRNQYLKVYYEKMNRPFCKIDDFNASNQVDAKVCLYVIKSIFDSALAEKHPSFPYEKTIQVGAALTDVKMEDSSFFDDVGENISNKNRQFCELTGMYWMWKHAQEDIVGLEHYRRHFILPEDWVERMVNNNIDVILPVPLYVAPSLEENYKFRHDPVDWEFMLSYLKENLPEDYETASAFFKETCLYSPCNMFIMRKEVLDKFCSWVFPILFATVENGKEKADAYLNRYPGFLAERLLTYYFEKHRDEFKVVYADKDFRM